LKRPGDSELARTAGHDPADHCRGGSAFFLEGGEQRGLIFGRHSKQQPT
jgi:hypothetical protein